MLPLGSGFCGTCLQSQTTQKKLEFTWTCSQSHQTDYSEKARVYLSLPLFFKGIYFIDQTAFIIFLLFFMCRRSEQWTGSGHSPRELPHAHVCPLPLHQSAELRLGPGLPSGNEGHEVSQSPKASVSSPVLLWSTLAEAAKKRAQKNLKWDFFYDS